MNIELRDCTVGSIKLSSDAALTAQREFDNVTFGIPLQVTTEGKPLNRRWILCDLTADLRAQGTSSSLLGSRRWPEAVRAGDRPPRIPWAPEYPLLHERLQRTKPSGTGGRSASAAKPFTRFTT